MRNSTKSNKLVYGMGYRSDSSAMEDGVKKQSYIIWINMIKRCYYTNDKAYENCEVAKEWLNFDTFEKWYDENHIEGYVMDKDLRRKRKNKIYSPETVSFVPVHVNQLFTQFSIERDLPHGVHYCKKSNKYIARMSSLQDGKKVSIYLGVHETVESAFKIYKKTKEAYIKTVAERYKDTLHPEVYKTIMNYKVTMPETKNEKERRVAKKAWSNLKTNKFRDCLCKEWQDFNNFYDWYKENCKEDYVLASTIINKDLKEFSPETCVYIPSNVHKFLYKSKENIVRKHNLPEGVSLIATGREPRYKVQFKVADTKPINKYFKNVDTAEAYYKTLRRDYGKALLEQYPDLQNSIKELLEQ